MLATKPKIVSLKTSNKIAPKAPIPDSTPQGEVFSKQQMASTIETITIINLMSCKQVLIGYLMKKWLFLNERLITDKNLFSKTGRYIITINPAILFNIVRN